ncbi:hypothetical protein H8E52_02425 [bacterium]|nr:hypothetical protein [bacterium]
MSVLRTLLTCTLLFAISAGAQEVEFTLVSGDPGMVNHWPDADAHIGTVDDHVSASCSPRHCSGTNALGSYSYNAFDFGVFPDDTGIPPGGYEAISFLEGTVSIDMDVAVNGGGPLVTAMSISGTEPFNGHGAYVASIAVVNSGSYNPAGKAFTLNVDLEAAIGGPPDTSLDFDLSGTAWIIDAADFGNITGDTYLDDVLLPRAIAQSATSLVYIRMMGTVPPAEGGTWGAMPLLAEVLGFTDAVSTETTDWGTLKANY